MNKLLVLLAIPLLAAVQIHSVYYDPVEHQTGGEYVLLENTGDHPVSIEGWKIATTISDQDATLIGSIPSRSTYLAADKDFNELKDHPDWPSPDHEEQLTLANTNGFAQLTTPQGDIISTVGWGEAQRSEETPHPGAAKGEALIRVNNTGDNKKDFKAKSPAFPPKPTTTNVSLEVTVEQTPPKILHYTLPDDNEQSPGVQLKPSTTPRELNISVTIQDNNTNHDVTVTANGHNLTTNQTATTTTYHGRIPYTNEEHITILASDTEHTDEVNIPIKHLQAPSINVPTGIQLNISPGEVATTTIPVTNSGDYPVDLQIKGTAPTWAQQHLGNVTYQLAGKEYNLTNAFRTHSIALEANQEIPLEIHVHATNAPASTYAGQIIIAGVRPR